jgi:hypothetical protein
MSRTVAPAGIQGATASSSAFWVAKPIAPSVASTRQRQGPVPVAHRQHQHLMAIRQFGLIHNQDDGLVLADRLLQDLARERLHDLVAEDQRIA